MAKIGWVIDVCEYERMTMKDLPDSDKPYEKLEHFGATMLSDAELLAIVLRTGSKKERAVELAQRILSADELTPGLVGLTSLSLKDLQQIKGIGKVKSVQIKAILELSKRIAKNEALSKVKITSPSSVAAVYMEEMRYLKQENFKLIFLDTKNQIISDKILTIGSVNASIVNPRDVFVEALNHEAVNIIMIHNHPSGDPTPSMEDINITKRLISCGNIIGVNVLDHIIIGDGRYISLKEKKVC